MTEAITLEGHAEYLANDAHAAGLNAAFGFGHLGVINFTAAEGGDAQGSGLLLGLGAEHRGSEFSFVANTLKASRDYAQVGEPLNPDMRMRQRSLLQAGAALGRFGSLSLAYVHESYRDSPTQQTMSLTHSISFGHAGNLNLTLSRIHTDAQLSTPSQNSTSAYLIYVLPFDMRRAATLSAVSGSGPGSPKNEVIAGVTQSPPSVPAAVIA